ncbi:ATP-dependent protease La [Peniophora sp. CONT]|nr:ATP-dependent protease La [Peniophora sp. CONT]
MADTSTPTIPILALPHPFVLLTGGIINLGLTRAQADALARLIDSSSTTPRVAAVPLVPSSSNDDDKARLYEWGVLARITQLVRSPSRRPAPYIVTLTGLTRIHLPTASSSDPFSAPLLRLPYSPITSSNKISSETIRSFKSAALKLFDRLANDESQREGVRERWSALATVLEEARGERVVMLADALVGVLGVEYKDRLHLLQLEPNQMIRNLTELIEKENLTASAGIHPPKLISGRRSDATTSSPGNTSDEFDASSDPDTDPDGLLELKTKIELLGVGTEERKVAVGEWKRLKRIPNASAEWAVVRGYIEWIVSVPWPASQHPSPQPQPDTKQSQEEQSTSAFLAAAREQLDADHYGLDHVKRRLVEYLAVVRLLEAQEAKVVALEKVEAEAKMKVEAEEAEKEEKAEREEEKEKDQEVTSRALVKASSPPSLPPPPPSTPTPTPQPSTLSLPPRKRLTPRGPILLFVGPPGTGKTSLGTSIAHALNRPFQRIALGGVRDEGEIRGHRRTYVASSPGLIVQALRRAGRSDPVILLDEVDKVAQGGGVHGDPSAALLEVLDPEQNAGFRDHYLNIPFDLSGVLFLCTANTLDTIPPALKDRCEIVRVPGYTAKEKGEIAKRFLVKRVIERCGMREGDVILGEGVIEEIVRGYTAEAGVRGLERAVAGVVRYKAVQFAEGSSSGTPYEKVVRVEDLEGILGVPRWDGEREREERAGVVYGLVVTGMGEGEVMPVESIAVPGKGSLKLTGSLGDVIKESGEIALSWVVAHASRLGLPFDVLNERGMDIHLHLPSGAQKKDGPSAGVAIACAFVSLLRNEPIPSDTAMTGEITLRGRVTPVGGIKEKVLGAHRSGVKRVILPYANRRDVEYDVPGEIRESMKFVFVRSVEEALKVVFGEDRLEWKHIIVT